MLAMQRAEEGLAVRPDRVLVDGNRCPVLPMPSEPVIQGDGRVPAIAAASILAKVARDREMQELELLYPGYGIGKHKGYPTPEHLSTLKVLGATPIHRRSFAPVRGGLAVGPGTTVMEEVTTDGSGVAVIPCIFVRAALAAKLFCQTGPQLPPPLQSPG